MDDPAASRRRAGPAICLNMIVRNEAHVIREGLDAVAPYIASWVIVDTGSDDGTQAVIREHMAGHGIPGELHERPWRNFGHNRSEALRLAQGHGDYIWVMDADDTVTGDLDFSTLTADVYAMRIRDGDTACIYWRRQVFRDGMPWRYDGVVHEYADCDEPFVEARLDGDYYIESRRLGGRNLDPQKYARDRDLLLAEVERRPDDARSVFYLAQSYFNLGDFANARDWSARRAEMGGWDEEVYYAKFRVAESMSRLGAPWPDVQDAFLLAFEDRPVRAEALHAIASRYRADQRYELGYLYARRAAEIPLPEDDILFVDADIYHWRAADEQAVCASWIGRHEESFAICRRLLARADVPADDRQRIASNRDISVPAMIDAACDRQSTAAPGPRPHDGDVTVTLVAGPDRDGTERTLDSFLHCCADVARVGRFIIVDTGLSGDDRAALLERYRFVEFTHAAAEFESLRAVVDGRYWLHLGQNWRFFAPESLIGRLIAVFAAEPDVFQVGVNHGDADTLTGACAPEDTVRRASGAGRYVLTGAVASGPAMIDTTRLDHQCTASLDEVLCVWAG